MVLLAVIGGVILGLFISISWNEIRVRKLKNALKEMTQFMTQAREININLQKAYEQEYLSQAPSLEELMEPKNIELIRVTCMEEFDHVISKGNK